MKKYLFNQPAGLGDIMFIMTIAQKFHEEGHDIIWPTAANYIEHQKNFPEVKFIQDSNFFMYNYYDSKHFIYEDDEYKVFPFRWADVILSGGKTILETQMIDKYNLINLPWEMWRTFKITRDYKKEDELFNLLGLSDNKEFNLINENQTRIYQKTKIEVYNGLQNVYMNLIPGYNMLDWLKVIYKAKTIHSVATSLTILLEKLEDLNTEMHVYKRIWQTPHSMYSYYMNKEYIYHE